VITAIAPFIGLLIASQFYLTGSLSVQNFANNGWIKPIRNFWFSGWGMDKFYDYLVVRPFKTFWKLNRNDVVDGLNTAIVLLCFGGHLLGSTLQTGRIRWYAASMMLGVVTIIAIGWST